MGEDGRVSGGQEHGKIVHVIGREGRIGRHKAELLVRRGEGVYASTSCEWWEKFQLFLGRPIMSAGSSSRCEQPSCKAATACCTRASLALTPTSPRRCPIKSVEAARRTDLKEA